MRLGREAWENFPSRKRRAAHFLYCSRVGEGGLVELDFKDPKVI